MHIRKRFKVMIVGSGGREHALCWKISQSPFCKEIVSVPGNPGIAQLGRCIKTNKKGVGNIVDIARREDVDLVIIGSEIELAAGLVDLLHMEGISAFGPTASASILEASKSFTKELMTEIQIPTATYSIHTNVKHAIEAAKERNGHCVIKADGLAAGKGVIVCSNIQEAESAIKACLEQNIFGSAGSKIIVEDFLQGRELSILALCDGTNIVPMVATQDHKSIFNGNTGPNTGGMGAYAPVPIANETLLKNVQTKILKPIVKTMANKGKPITGVIYAGLMICNEQPYVLEFNTRFGDPETQAILMLLESDLLPLLIACTHSKLTGLEKLIWRKGATVCVVMSVDGYPGSYNKGFPISELPEQDDVMVFHAGTTIKNNRIVTSGGRVLGVTAYGNNIVQAREKAYKYVNSIHFDNKYYRTDIAEVYL
jgi:phosphoribosylamine--glycine ligase